MKRMTVPSVLGGLLLLNMALTWAAGAPPAQTAPQATAKPATATAAAPSLPQAGGVALANTCAGCHGTDGQSAGETMPVISGLPKEYFVKVMHRFKSGDRYSTIMGRIAKGFSDADIEAMAEFFASKPWKSAETTADAQRVARGEQLHQELCGNCHLANGKYTEYTMPRIAGQWRDYLSLQIKECAVGKARVPQPTLMSKRLAELKEEDLAALADFYASQK